MYAAWICEATLEHAELTPRAAQLLRTLNLQDSPTELIESFSNAVWLTPDHVVHYHVIGLSGRLEHEARVAARLPPEALYPEVVAVGRDGEHDWLVTRRAPGVPLTEAWPSLTLSERRDATHQVAAALRAVHSSHAQDLVPPCLQRSVPVLSRRDLAVRLRSLELPPAFERLLAAADPPSVMAHGDFNFNQVMWHEGRVTALLDLEMSHAETPDWDLAPFLAFCWDPVRSVPEYLEAVSRPEDYAKAPAWLREAYPEMFVSAALHESLALHLLVLRSPELLAQRNHCEQLISTAWEDARKLASLLS